jgi:hypothetical protein
MAAEMNYERVRRAIEGVLFGAGRLARSQAEEVSYEILRAIQRIEDREVRDEGVIRIGE